MKRTKQFNMTLSEEETKMLDDLGAWMKLASLSDVLRQLIRREHEVSKTLTPLEVTGALGRACREKKENRRGR